jgi:hypothetical protein
MLKQHRFVFGALCSACVALSQVGGGGTIQGVVTDPSGAVVPAATVTATNVATGVKSVRETTAAGVYSVAPLQVGSYDVTVAVAGFQTVTHTNINVDALAVVGLDITLQVGDTATAVTVTDTTPPINTEDVRMGQTIRQELYTALPLAMGNAPRSPTAFVALMPGITGGGGSNDAGNVLGGQPNSQEVYVEGIALTNPVIQGEVRNVSLGVSVEAVDQFQLETAGAAVQFGGQGATNFVIKSGTNNFHGAMYEYFRNTVLDARGYFARRDTPEHQNQFGANLGGPVIRNKIFFFANYDGFRYRTESAGAFASVPTPQMRAGDFSQLPVVIYDPATTTTNAAGVRTRQPFPGNIIPPERISSISKYFQQWLPDPVNSAIQSNYLGTLPFGFNNDNTTNKGDVYLSSAHQLSGVFSMGRRAQATLYRNAGNNLPLPYADTRMVKEHTLVSQIRHNWVPSGNIVNQLSYGYTRFNVPITNVTMDDHPKKAGLTGLPPGEADSAFPEIAFAGPNVPTNWRGTNSRAFLDLTNTFTLQDNLQWTTGKHAVTFGGEVQWSQINGKERLYGSLANWNFSNLQTAGFNAAGALNTATGHAYASYLLGAVNSAGITDDYVVGIGGRYRTYSWWVNDNFKVTPRLNLMLGLRHDIMTPYVEVADRMSFFDPNLPNPAIGGFPGALVFAGSGQNSCNCRTPIKTFYKNFQPRVGLAYKITQKTVFRAGYSVNTTHRGAVGGRGGARTGTGLLGYSASPSFTSLDGGISPAFDWDAGVPAYQRAPFFEPTLNTGFYTGRAQGGSVTYGDPEIGGHPPRYQSWSGGFQHALLSSLTLGIHYVGSNGHYLQGGARAMWSNQIDPKYLALGTLLTQTANPANIALAQRQFSEIRLPYANFTGSIGQMLRPFPQYSGLGDPYNMVGNMNYNSMQITADKRMSKGLSFQFNYTFGKGFDDLGSRTAYQSEKAQTLDPNHILNLLFVYQLPFGKGRAISPSNSVISAIVSGWQLSGITTYRSGGGFGSIGAACNLPNAGGCYADFNPNFSGEVRINGDYRVTDRMGNDTTVFLDRNAFQNPAPFTYGNTPRSLVYKLHNPSDYNQSLSVRREFPIHESWKLAFQMDTFNTFNWVTWGNPNTNITNANFGRITSQGNSPRVVQLNARITF